jgi:hypothetical protein
MVFKLLGLLHKRVLKLLIILLNISASLLMMLLRPQGKLRTIRPKLDFKQHKLALKLRDILLIKLLKPLQRLLKELGKLLKQLQLMPLKLLQRLLEEIEKLPLMPLKLLQRLLEEIGKLPLLSLKLLQRVLEELEKLLLKWLGMLVKHIAQ